MRIHVHVTWNNNNLSQSYRIATKFRGNKLSRIRPQVFFRELTFVVQLQFHEATPISYTYLFQAHVTVMAESSYHYTLMMYYEYLATEIGEDLS